MKYSGIGGQAVMEGVMMRNGSNYAIAVRTMDKTIDVTKKKTKTNTEKWNKVPIVRGVIAFVDSLVLGMSSLSHSASFFEEEDKDETPKTKEELAKKEKKEKVEMTATICFSIVLAMGLFMALPYFLSQLFHKLVVSPSVLALIEGLIRVAIFIIYVAAISMMEDIKRVFMYHGAEHKCINCIEHGLELNVENVRKSSKQHKRCGTNFLMIVLVVSIFVFMFIRPESKLIQLLLRILLVPVIAGISYEFIRLAGRYENAFTNFISKPGMWLQNLTTKEPDDDMIEVGIASVEAVFDWKKFQEENKEFF